MSGLAAVNDLVGIEGGRLRVLREQAAQELRDLAARHQEPGSLLPHGYRVYSQNFEDGMIAEIFRRVGETNRHFVEIGSGDGLENNTLHLLLGGWSGLWIEADAPACVRARTRLKTSLDAGRLRILNDSLTPDNVESLLRRSTVQGEPDLLSLDIDGNDWWVWRALSSVRPRVVVIEYNAAFGPDAEWIKPYDADFRWSGTRFMGASLRALERLGRDKGYALVGCDIRGVNAFFVREDLPLDRFLGPLTAAKHFQPPRYDWPVGAGHPPDDREFLAFPKEPL